MTQYYNSEHSEILESPPSVALITGASRRLGAVIAEYLHNQGYRLIIHYRSGESEAQTLARKLEDIRANSVRLIQSDLASADYQAFITEAVEYWGYLNVLINNASGFYPTSIEDINEKNWQDLMDSNLRIPAFLSQAAAPYLLQTKGCIINMIDIFHARPMPGHIIYTSAKAGLAGLTRSLALELAPDIRVNGVAPGAILWPENEGAEHQQKVLSKIPLQRIGQPLDIAKTIYFLCSAEYITGEIIHVDGGRSLQQ